MPEPMMPVPFGKQSRLIKFDAGDSRLQQLVAHLMECEHGHNFLVQKDHHRVYLSDTAIECVRAIIGDCQAKRESL